MLTCSCLSSDARLRCASARKTEIAKTLHWTFHHVLSAPRRSICCHTMRCNIKCICIRILKIIILSKSLYSRTVNCNYFIAAAVITSGNPYVIFSIVIKVISRYSFYIYVLSGSLNGLCLIEFLFLIFLYSTVYFPQYK